jgi:hypothetical protein
MDYTSPHKNRASSYLGGRSKDRYGVHRYTFDDLGVRRDAVAKLFQPYRDKYHVPKEI